MKRPQIILRNNEQDFFKSQSWDLNKSKDRNI